MGKIFPPGNKKMRLSPGHLQPHVAWTNRQGRYNSFITLNSHVQSTLISVSWMDHNWYSSTLIPSITFYAQLNLTRLLSYILISYASQNIFQFLLFLNPPSYQAVLISKRLSIFFFFTYNWIPLWTENIVCRMLILINWFYNTLCALGSMCTWKHILLLVGMF